MRLLRLRCWPGFFFQRDDLEAPLFCVYIRWGAERMRFFLDLSASPASASASASAVALSSSCLAAWCNWLSDHVVLQELRDRGGAGPNKLLSSCLAGVAMCCKRQAAWRLICVVLVIPLGHVLGRGVPFRVVFPGCCGPHANDVGLHL